MSEKEPNGSFVRVSNREIYDGLVQVRERLTSLENRVDNVLGENVDMRKRLRKLELHAYALTSGLVAAFPVMGRMLGAF